MQFQHMSEDFAPSVSLVYNCQGVGVRSLLVSIHFNTYPRKHALPMKRNQQYHPPPQLISYIPNLHAVLISLAARPCPGPAKSYRGPQEALKLTHSAGPLGFKV
jgi:hypothetical protein